jgi:agmatinase
MSMRLVLNQRMAIESRTDSEAVVFDFDTNARFKLTTAVYDLVRRFSSPVRVDDALAGHPAGERLTEVVANLFAKGILVAEQGSTRPPEVPLVASTRTLFNCPRRDPRAPTDVSVAGLPFDLGNTVAAGARDGPEAIRTWSRQYDYRLDFLTGQPVGWFSLDTEERILEGVTFSDWGDLWFGHGEAPEKIFARIGDICEDIVRSGSFPLFLGGDHSVSFPVVECLQHHQPLTVLWLDAHNDLGRIVPDSAHDHASVARRIVGLPNVTRVVQVGLKGYTIYRELELGGDKVISVPAARLRRRGISPVLDLIPAGDGVYVSLDIDVVDPVCAPGTSTPVPGGLVPDEVQSFLSTVGLNREVIGMDLVEVNPLKDRDDITSRVACQLLLAAMGGIMRRRLAARESRPAGKSTAAQ